MTNQTVSPITDEQLEELESAVSMALRSGATDKSGVKLGTSILALIARLRAAEVDAARWCLCKRMPRTWWLEAVDQASRKGGRSLDEAADAAMKESQP